MVFLALCDSVCYETIVEKSNKKRSKGEKEIVGRPFKKKSGASYIRSKSIYRKCVDKGVSFFGLNPF